jgi:hypothetical protein
MLRAQGPPCGLTTTGRFFGSASFGSVRYPWIVRPSRALYDVELPVIERKEQRRHRFLEIRREHRPEILIFLFAIQQRLVDAVGRDSNAEPAIVIRHPGSDVARILSDQLFFTCNDIDAKDIENLGITPVMRDDDMRIVIDESVDDLRQDLLAGREVFQILALKIDRHDVEILVASKVLDVKDAIAFPEITRNIARRLARHPRCHATDRLYENVKAPFEGRHEGEVFAVRRDLMSGFLWILEEVT